MAAIEIETGESHPDSLRITGEWILKDGAPSFFIWQPKELAVVLGASQSAEQEIDVQVAERLRLRVCKRRGGGGTVLLGPHCLCIAMKLERIQNQGPLDYFAKCNTAVIECLARCSGIQLTQRGISDLAFGERKVGGTSLYLSRHLGLYLASILVTRPGPIFDEVLKYPSRAPDYRLGRSHRDFITDLSELGLQSSLSEIVTDFSEAMRGQSIFP